MTEQEVVDRLVSAKLDDAIGRMTVEGIAIDKVRMHPSVLRGQVEYDGITIDRDLNDPPYLCMCAVVVGQRGDSKWQIPVIVTIKEVISSVPRRKLA
jgi:hypothetical protein